MKKLSELSHLLPKDVIPTKVHVKKKKKKKRTIQLAASILHLNTSDLCEICAFIYMLGATQGLIKPRKPY